LKLTVIRQSVSLSLSKADYYKTDRLRQAQPDSIHFFAINQFNTN
jgi:hypothetical protein